MSLETLDRTLWSYAEALAHVQNVTVARRAAEAAKLPPKPQASHHYWGQPQDPAVAWRQEAETELLVALRDGDLIAQGRYTEERTPAWGYAANSSGFGLHSGYHTSIRPEQWREGKYLLDRLTALNWEFIDIRMLRFMVKAIWPEFVPAVARAQTGREMPYTTPYLDLMQTAIAHFAISCERGSTLLGRIALCRVNRFQRSAGGWRGGKTGGKSHPSNPVLPRLVRPPPPP